MIDAHRCGRYSKDTCCMRRPFPRAPVSTPFVGSRCTWAALPAASQNYGRTSTCRLVRTLWQPALVELSHLTAVLTLIETDIAYTGVGMRLMRCAIQHEDACHLPTVAFFYRPPRYGRRKTARGSRLAGFPQFFVKWSCIQCTSTLPRYDWMPFRDESG